MKEKQTISVKNDLKLWKKVKKHVIARRIPMRKLIQELLTKESKENKSNKKQ